jgi:mRNA interferase HigB
MRVIAKAVLRDFWEVHPDSEQALRAWHQAARVATWQAPADVKARFLSASILRDNRVVFDICGNKYRLVMKIRYEFGIVYIRFVGTHAQYDATNAQTV